MPVMGLCTRRAGGRGRAEIERQAERWIEPGSGGWKRRVGETSQVVERVRKRTIGWTEANECAVPFGWYSPMQRGTVFFNTRERVQPVIPLRESWA